MNTLSSFHSNIVLSINDSLIPDGNFSICGHSQSAICILDNPFPLNEYSRQLFVICDNKSDFSAKSPTYMYMVLLGQLKGDTTRGYSYYLAFKYPQVTTCDICYPYNYCSLFDTLSFINILYI